MVPARMSVVTLGARDVGTLAAFYVALDWPSRSIGDLVSFDLGGGYLNLYPLELLAAEANLPPTPGDGFRGVTLAVVVERRELVDPAMDAVVRAGGRVLAAPVDREWGGYSGYFADPEGNAWEIAWMPGAMFDERNALVWPS